MKSPINFEQFSKDPVKGLLFIVISAVAYLYFDNKVNYTEQIDRQGAKIEVLEVKVDRLQYQLHKSDSALAGAISKLSILDKLCVLEAK
jgi:hypothetical protein|tara:strand:+ start:5153 stop:5419 length:267 start_codon:yes stop_codon:yes gene_type:complete